MRLRRLLALLLVMLVTSTGYIASPFVSAWTLREAIKRGDAAAIEPRIEWPSVRATLKSSLAKQADLLPMATEAGAAVKPTIWQRIKNAFGATMLDRFIEAYVTPEGLPKLMDYRRTWQTNIAATAVPEEPESPVERFKQFWARIHRAEFKSPGVVEIEIADRQVPDRRYVTTMELMGLGWKMTALHIVSHDEIERMAGVDVSTSMR